jgi:capsule polysaccharide export protein KpsE/RkpR
MPTVVVEPELRTLPEPPPLLRAAIDGAVRRWRFVAIMTLGSFVVGVPLAWRMPSWFQAGVRMVPTPSRQLPVKLPGFEQLDGATPDDTTGPGGYDGAAELGRLLSILHSRTVTDDTIRRFDLLGAYHGRSIEDLRELFWNRLASTNLVTKEGYVELIIEDTNAARAAQIANYMAGAANKVTRRISTAAAQQERTFLEHRLDEARRQLETAAQAFRDFQEQHKVVNIDVQADGVMSTMLRLKEQLINEEIELRRLKGFASRDEPSVEQSRRRVRALRDQIAKLEESAGQEDFFTKLEEVPALKQEGDRLARDLKLKTSVYELLLREYEMAKLAEVRDTRTFELLDAAVVATRKVRPSRSLAALGVGLIGFLLSFTVAAACGAWPVLRGYRA